MIDQPESAASRPSRPFLRGLLLCFTALMGIEVGAGAFVTFVIFPLWTASPGAAIGWTGDMPYYVEEGRFFIFASPLLFLLSVATLIASWHVEPHVRTWLRIATVSFIIIFVVTLAYFVPAQNLMKGQAGTKIPAAELGSMLRRFVTLNWVRQASGLLAFGAALHAFALSYRAAGRSET